MRITLEGVVRRLLPVVPVGRALAHREWRTLANVADVLLEGAPHGISAEQTADNVEGFLIAGRSRRAWRVRVLLHLIEFLPVADCGRTFSAMSRDRRRALVKQKWIGGTHLWRISAKIRNLVVFGAYGDRRAAAKTGYVPVSLRPRFKSLKMVSRANGAA